MLEPGDGPAVAEAIGTPGNAKWGWGKLSLLLTLQPGKPPVVMALGDSLLLSRCVPGLESLQPRSNAWLEVMPGLGHHGWDLPAAPAAEISQGVSPSLPHPQQI